MVRATPPGLATRAVATAVIHASAFFTLGVAWLGACVVLLFVLVGIGGGAGVLIAGLIAVTAPVYVVVEVFRSVHEGREQLLTRVVPVEIGRESGWLPAGVHCLAGIGADEQPTHREIREQVGDLFADASEPASESGDESVPDAPTHDDRRLLVETTRRLAAQADVPVPTLGVHPAETPLCYTVHHDGHVFLVVSRGLLQRLPARELVAVLAHEITHLANADHRIMSWVTVPLFVLEGVMDPDRRGRDDRSDREELRVEHTWWDLGLRETVAVGGIFAGHVAVGAVLLAVAIDGPFLEVFAAVVQTLFILLTILTVIVVGVAAASGALVGIVVYVPASVACRLCLPWASLGTGLFSRGREFAADRAAARLTGNPGALAAALRRLDDSLDEPPPQDLRELSHTCDALSVMPALDPESDGGGGLFATHPPTEVRIRRLRELEREQERA